MTLVNQASEFDPTARAQIPQVASLESVIRLALTSFSHELRVCMPAKVTQVRNSYRVDVQPLFQAQYLAEQAPTTLRVVPNVPILMPGGVNWQVRYPVDAGDVGLLLCADRAIDTFLAGSGDPVDPADARFHELTDAIYLPGLAYDSLAQARADASTDLVMRNGTAEVRLERNGTFRIYSGDRKLELVDLVGQLAAHCENVVTILQQAMVITLAGPMPLYAASQASLASALSTVDLIKTSINELKGT